MRRILSVLAIATLAAGAFVLPIGSTSPAGAADQAVYVVHGIAGVPVDVCLDGTVAIPGFNPGDVKGPLPIPAGAHTIALIKPGSGDCATAIFSATATIPVGSSTVVAWNKGTTDTVPALAVFPNSVDCTSAGNGRVTAIHAAGAAGAVNVLANGAVVVPGLAQGTQASLDVPAATYSVEVQLASGGTTVLGPAPVKVAEGVDTVVVVVNALTPGGQPASPIPFTINVGVCAAPVVPAGPSFTG